MGVNNITDISNLGHGPTMSLAYNYNPTTAQWEPQTGIDVNVENLSVAVDLEWPSDSVAVGGLNTHDVPVSGDINVTGRLGRVPQSQDTTAVNATKTSTVLSLATDELGALSKHSYQLTASSVIPDAGWIQAAGGECISGAFVIEVSNDGTNWAVIESGVHTGYSADAWETGVAIYDTWNFQQGRVRIMSPDPSVTDTTNVIGAFNVSERHDY